MNKKQIMALVAVFLFGSAAAVVAEPVLQVYLEGATYDQATGTWLSQGTGDPLRLWVIAQTPVEAVRLSIAYEAGATPTISLKGSATGDYGGFTDPSPAANPTYIQTVTDGSSPLLGDGSSLPSHGIYGDGVAWQEFSLGDFTLNDSPIADFINSLPAPGDKTGQINVYDVSISGVQSVHFDVYDHIGAETDAEFVFAPLGHDAEAGHTPAPGAALLALIGMGSINLLRRYLR